MLRYAARLRSQRELNVCFVHSDREGPPPTLERGYALFEELLLKHSVERPPFSVAVFAYPEVKAINDYVINRFVRLAWPAARMSC